MQKNRIIIIGILLLVTTLMILSCNYSNEIIEGHFFNSSNNITLSLDYDLNTNKYKMILSKGIFGYKFERNTINTTKTTNNIYTIELGSEKYTIDLYNGVYIKDSFGIRTTLKKVDHDGLDINVGTYMMDSTNDSHSLEVMDTPGYDKSTDGFYVTFVDDSHNIIQIESITDVWTMYFDTFYNNIYPLSKSNNTTINIEEDYLIINKDSTYIKFKKID